MYQIQPLQNNSNPLWVQLGNPDLRPIEQFKFTLSTYFNHAIAQRNLWANVSMTLLKNDIVSSTEYQENGQTIQKYIQTNGNYNLNTNIYYSFIFKPLMLRNNIGMWGYLNKTKSITNGIDNKTWTYGISPSVTISKDIDSLFSINASYRIDYGKNIIENQYKTVNEQFKHNISMGAEFYLPFNCTFKTEVDWNLLPKNNVYNTNNSYILWGMELVKSFPKLDLLEISLKMNDVLNQNQSVNRNFYGNTLQESFSQAIGRIVMINATWKFKKKPKQVSTNENLDND